MEFAFWDPSGREIFVVFGEIVLKSKSFNNKIFKGSPRPMSKGTLAIFLGKLKQHVFKLNTNVPRLVLNLVQKISYYKNI